MPAGAAAWSRRQADDLRRCRASGGRVTRRVTSSNRMRLEMVRRMIERFGIHKGKLGGGSVRRSSLMLPVAVQCWWSSRQISLWELVETDTTDGHQKNAQAGEKHVED